MTSSLRPFRVAVPQSDLDDLNSRLEKTRWPERDLPVPGGVPLAELRELAAYWRTGYDWRRHEARLNRFPQFRTDIDGQEVHFLHVRSADPDALPLLLTHGWPNSFVEFAELIDRLTGRFHVVVPSLPGFGYSAAPRTGGWTAARVARLWAELMRRLGHDRYGVEGGDFGAYVAPEVALADPAHVVGVYVIGGLGFPSDADVPDLTPQEKEVYDALQSADWMHGVDHHALLRTAPATFAYGWQDSPAGALAWMLQKFHDFNASGGPLFEAIDRDLFLTNVSLYWFTGTFGTSSWPYYDSPAGPFAWPRGQKAVPTGVYSGDAPAIRRLAERHNTIAHWPTGNPGGHHFVAMDQPEAFAADLTRFFDAVNS
ncbi:epoxide hydrolase family protein [Streptomyces sp. YJ-C3]